MPRNVASSIENNFTRGLISEASGLNFPENACTDTDNCHFELTGRVRRRNGINLESGYALKAVNRTGCTISTYLWRNVAGDGNTTLFVAQIGSTLYFYNVTPGQSLSAGALSTTINLATYQPIGAPSLANVECHFADGNGYLFVTNPYMEAIYVSYNTTTATASATQISIYQRDFAGDPADPQSRTDQSRTTTTLAGMNVSHYYNLLNQGWTVANLTTWDTGRTDMPNNIDVMWLYKDSTETFTVSLVDKMIRGNTPAPNGHYILSIYNQDRQTASGLGGVTNTNTGTNRCGTVAFFAGRVFYAGLKYPGYSGNIYFSQIIAPGSTAEFGRCYQANDPTAEDLSDPLPNDGGVITIPDSGTVVKLWATAGGIVAFCTNGVWLITGSTGIGFTATDYTVRRLAEVRTLSGTSFVNVGGMPAWWASEGIYILQADDTGTGLSIQSMTDKTLLTWYQAIPLSSKRLARGYFNIVTKRLQWVYKSTESNVPEEQFEYDKILNFNVLTGAFFPWSLSILDPLVPKIHGIVAIDNIGGDQSEAQVIDDSSNTVINDSGDLVTVYTVSTVIAPRFKYFVSFPNSGTYVFTVAEESTTGFTDWNAFGGAGGTDYSSYFITGYKLHGKALTKWEPNYINIYSQSLPGAYVFQSYRDFANSANAGNWSTRQQTVTIAADNYTIKRNRLKTRGQGHSIQFKISSVPGQNFDIVGWSTFESSNAAP